jgi:ribonuclease HI
MSAQKMELIALTKTLELGASKKINIYTDSRYAFATAHIHGAIYQEYIYQVYTKTAHIRGKRNIF